MLATTRGALLRGTSTFDQYGDEIESNDEPAPVYTPWQVTRRNLIKNPRLVGAIPPAWTTGTMTSAGDQTADPFADYGTYCRFTKTTPNASAAFRAILGLDMPNDGETISVLAPIRCSVAMLITVQARWVSTSPGTLVGTFNAPAGESLLSVTGPTFNGAATSGATGSALAFILPTAGLGGATVDVPIVDLEIAPPIAFPFDGYYGGSELERASWEGVANASASALETRAVDPAQPFGYNDFPLSLIERDVDEFDPASGEWRSVRKLVGRVPSHIPVDDGDRIRDNRDGAIYTVEGFTSTARGLSGRSSVSINLKRTSP